MALVVVPTLSTVLTGASGPHLSESAYGTLFIPQSLLAIAFSLAGARMTQRIGPRATLLAGFVANGVAMAAIAATASFGHEPGAAYATLLGATSFLGIGFAIVTPTLNVLAGTLAPNDPARAVLVVNALLGGSAALAPLLLVAFAAAGRWWGLPLACAAGMLALLAAALRVPFDAPARTSAPAPRAARTRLPKRVALFAAFAFAYGLCEQINGSWAPLYMTHELGAGAAAASLALALFWATATAGRVAFAVTSEALAPTTVFRTLPFVLALAFLVLALLPAHAPAPLGVAAFALAGLGVSALLPLSLSFTESSMPGVATAATSVVFAAYLVGYGLAAFGVGPLQSRGIAPTVTEGCAVGIALVVAALAAAIVKTSGHTA